MLLTKEHIFCGQFRQVLKYRYLKLGEVSPMTRVCHTEEEFEIKSQFPV